jgi:RHS repeat-associated protein
VVYDGDGNRVSKPVNGLTTKYLVDTNNLTGYAQVVEELQNNLVVKQYTYGLDLISQRQSSGVSFYNYDGHGSVRALSNLSGSVTDTYSYDAFGTLIEKTGNTDNSYLYAGEQFDSDLGFYYNRARYLNVNTGRFISQDSYEGNSSEPKSLHKYLYSGNNPIGNADPSGNSFIDKIGAFVINNILATLTVIQSAAIYTAVNAPNLLAKADFWLTALQIYLDIYGQLTVRREAQTLSMNMGNAGEDEVRKLLTEKGFDVKLSVQNNSGNGVDIIAQDPSGDWVYTEVKTSATNTNVNTPIALSGAQTDMENFVRSRLRGAADGRGNYSVLSPEARQQASQALRAFEESIESGRQTKALIAEVRLPMGYLTYRPRIPFSISFRRWR